MATSGTATFNLDINEIIEEAYERAGLGRAFSGNDFRTARRSLNLLAQDFANRGINLWTIEESTLSFQPGLPHTIYLLTPSAYWTIPSGPVQEHLKAT